MTQRLKILLGILAATIIGCAAFLYFSYSQTGETPVSNLFTGDAGTFPQPAPTRSDDGSGEYTYTEPSGRYDIKLIYNDSISGPASTEYLENSLNIVVVDKERADRAPLLLAQEQYVYDTYGNDFINTPAKIREQEGGIENITKDRQLWVYFPIPREYCPRPLHEFEPLQRINLSDIDALSDAEWNAHTVSAKDPYLVEDGGPRDLFFKYRTRLAASLGVGESAKTLLYINSELSPDGKYSTLYFTDTDVRGDGMCGNLDPLYIAFWSHESGSVVAHVDLRDGLKTNSATLARNLKWDSASRFSYDLYRFNYSTSDPSTYSREDLGHKYVDF